MPPSSLAARMPRATRIAGAAGGWGALGEPLDDVCGVPGLRGTGGSAHRPEAGGRVVVRDHEQARSYCDADQRAEVELDPAGWAGAGAQEPGEAWLVGDVVHQQQGDRQEGGGRDAARDDEALVERPLDVPDP